MPRLPDLDTVLVVGSGPIVIGQAAEFDYAGTQACRALREEGLRVVLVNTNPATIMTDAGVADRVYFEPLTVEHVAAVIARERPRGLLPTLGGQVGLNLAVALADAGVLERYGVRLLGTPLEAIRRAEDRLRFKETMLELGEPVPPSAVVSTVEAALAFAAEVGYPVVVRPAYTLGGTGGGLAANPDALARTAAAGLRSSPIGQALVEQSIAGLKEIEYEVMRDHRDTCITVCNMENLDPVGVHTGDSIVVAPSQTLSDRDYHRLRWAALRIIRALGIQGGCNIQFALDPASDTYYVIEVNPRVSRSSALASKATGYPIAQVAARIAVGLALDEIRNPVTGSTFACFEPTLDYVVVKVPRWPFDKFRDADRALGTQMKSTGEVMAIDRTLEGALLKAIRSLDLDRTGLSVPEVAALDDAALAAALERPSDLRLFVMAEALRRGFGTGRVARATGVDPFFLEKLGNVVAVEEGLKGRRLEEVNDGWLRRAKTLGLADRSLARLLGTTEDDVRARRRAAGVRPVYKMVDTCAAEFEAGTPYFYSTYEREDEAIPAGGPAVLVLGSGPIRIGQGVEFDYCSVHAVRALKAAGYRALIINNNPETVSTDFDTSDRLYFEPLTLEDVLHVVERERPVGVLVQFGGQTAVNLARPLAEAGVPLLGTTADAIDLAEDRERFDRLLAAHGIPRPPGGAASSAAEALEVAARVGYPVLVRPSYVLGGRAMDIAHTPADLEAYLAEAVEASPERPVLVDRYVPGVEVEVDAVSDGRDVLVAGILEHVERAGVHSGDSLAVYPCQRLSPAVQARVVALTTRLARALGVRGLLNAQFVVDGDQVAVLEVNPRASRTAPFLSKVTGLPLVALGTWAALGHSLTELGAPPGLWPAGAGVAVKAPVFSWAKLPGVEPGLGPEMKSTGEVMGLGRDLPAALYKALVAAGTPVAAPGGSRAPVLLATIADKDKPEALPLLAAFRDLGFSLVATAGTHRALAAAGIGALSVNKLHEGPPTILELIGEGRAAAEYGIPCLTSLETARALLLAVRGRAAVGQGTGAEAGPVPIALQDWVETFRAAPVPAGGEKGVTDAGHRASSVAG